MSSFIVFLTEHKRLNLPTINKGETLQHIVDRDNAILRIGVINVTSEWFVAYTYQHPCRSNHTKISVCKHLTIIYKIGAILNTSLLL